MSAILYNPQSAPKPRTFISRWFARLAKLFVIYLSVGLVGAWIALLVCTAAMAPETLTPLSLISASLLGFIAMVYSAIVSGPQVLLRNLIARVAVKPFEALMNWLQDKDKK